MAKGLPKSIIKKYGISKKAWSVFRGRKKSRSNPSKGKTKTKKRKGYKLGKKKRRRSREMTIPIAPIAGLLAAKATQNIVADITTGNFARIPRSAGGYLGLWHDGSFHLDELVSNMTPIVLGCLVHKFVGGKPLNLNRTLANAGVPFVRF